MNAASPTGDLSQWWNSLVAAALIGTTRTQAPPLPDLGIRSRDDATAEVALLDAAAIGGVLRAAGRPTLGGAELGEPCPPDAALPAPERAVQLLQLILDQPPVRRELQDELRTHWFRQASAHGRRLPHALLPTALTAATQHPELRAPLAQVLDERGRWLAAARPDWAWVRSSAQGSATDETADEIPSDDTWLHLSAAEQPAELRRIRAVDSARGRALAEQVLPSLNAKQRVAVLESLSVGLSAADEQLLESVLDDRAATVRSAACALLEGLPDSQRAARMATRLRAVLSVGGLLRKSLTVAELPEPDSAARRDGIGDAPKGVRRRAWVLEQVVAGAPLSVLTEVCGTDAAGVLNVDRDDVLWPGLLRAVAAQRDVAWARAMLERGWDSSLLGVLAADEREDMARRALDAAGSDPSAVSILEAVPGPWAPGLSEAAGEWVARAVGTRERSAVVSLDVAIIARLGPAALPGLQRALATSEAAAAYAARVPASRLAGLMPSSPATETGRIAKARHNVRILQGAVQYLSLIGLVDEAFT